MLRGELPKRDDLRILLAHGKTDARCPVEESLARVLEAANSRRSTSSSTGRTVPAEVVRGFVAFATGP
jgi:hypothetical protein